MKKVSIIVPVYADWPSLKTNIQSLKKYYTGKSWLDVYFANDCGPGANDLEKRIKASIKNIKHFHYYRNPQNLGFVRNCNHATFSVVDQESDILLLNSDTIVTKGSIEEMREVLYLDEATAAVNPRSNNAGVFGGVSVSVPMDNRYYNQPKLSYRYYRKVKKSLDRKYSTPAVSGFCVLIRREAINKVGLFDEIYENGYFDDNDFSMRLRKAGYKCSIANWAYIFHIGSKSFSDEYRIDRSRINQKVFLKRYPKYLDIIAKEWNVQDPISNHDSKARRIRGKVIKGLMYWHHNGIKSTLERIHHKKNAPQKIKIWMHELSNTGAPLALVDVIDQWVSKGKKVDDMVILHPNGSLMHESIKQRISNLGVKIVGSDAHDARLSDGDIVILNSAAYSEPFYDNLLTKLENNIAKHLFWYIHEDNEQWMPSLGNGDKTNIRRRMKRLIDDGRVTLYVPSSSTQRNWKKYFDVAKGIKIMPGRTTVRAEELLPKSAEDFDSINFVTTGTSGPHKGQLSVVYAFDAFYHHYYLKCRDRYRKFTFNIIGIDGNPLNYYASFINSASNDLGSHIGLYPESSVDEVHRHLRKMNFTITYSIVESFSIATMEGMAFGHPIIRSESSGQKEQLDGNGWPADTSKWYELVETIEEILNKTKTPNQKLADMSKRSLEIAKQNRSQNYALIKDINRYLSKDDGS